MRSHHAGMYNLFTCTWSCSCFRYSMASSSIVCTPKKNTTAQTHFSSYPARTQLKNLQFMAKEKEGQLFSFSNLVGVRYQALQRLHLLVDLAPPPLRPKVNQIKQGSSALSTENSEEHNARRKVEDLEKRQAAAPSRRGYASQRRSSVCCRTPRAATPAPVPAPTGPRHCPQSRLPPSRSPPVGRGPAPAPPSGTPPPR